MHGQITRARLTACEMGVFSREISRDYSLVFSYACLMVHVHKTNKEGNAVITHALASFLKNWERREPGNFRKKIYRHPAPDWGSVKQIAD